MAVSTYPYFALYVPQKSMLLSLVLTFSFGPFGIFYSAVLGGLITLLPMLSSVF